MNIINFVKISDQLASSGQPCETDFSHIAELGYKTVINLALATSNNAIAVEGDIITELGMSYVHIPIQWENPKIEQFRLFVAIMQQEHDNKVWVHCALNMRVSVFLYLYNTLYLEVAESRASEKLGLVWQPNDVWLQFIRNVKDNH